MNILFRADSSSSIGTGHIMRDLVLAQQYPNDNIIFATRELDGNINHKIDEASYKKVILKTHDIKELDKIIKKLKIDMLVIDHYDIDYKYEKQLKKKSPKLKIFSFDDTYEQHYCDILLNHNISADRKKYKSLVPKHCELRCGSKYTLLREEFRKEKKKKRKKPKRKIKTIFVAMGGADHGNINIEILKVLKKFKNIKVNLVTTRANRNLDKLKKYCKNRGGIDLYINSNQIAKLMRKSDLAIVTPSVTMNEVYFMKLPFIAIMTADNQRDMYDFLKNKNYLTMKSFNKKKLRSILNDTIN